MLGASINISPFTMTKLWHSLALASGGKISAAVIEIITGFSLVFGAALALESRNLAREYT
jgi:hypothetical protein